MFSSTFDLMRRERCFAACFMCCCVVVAGRAHAQGITLPKWINEERLEYLLPFLDASDQQVAAIRHMHKAYLANWHHSFAENIAALNVLSENVHVSPHKFVGQSMALSFAELRIKAAQLRPNLENANDTFLDEIQTILADGQISGLLRMRMAVVRMGLQRSLYGIPEKHIDIVDFLEKVVLPPADRVLVDAYILQNGLSYVAVMQDVARADERRETINFQIFDIDRMYQPGYAPPAAAVEEMRTLREKRGKLFINEWKRLVRENRQWLEVVTSMVSPDSAAMIRREYVTTAYPQVYPDASLADSIYEQSLQSPTLDEDQRAVLAAFRKEYLERHHLLSESLCRSLFDREVLIFTGHRTNQADAKVKMDEARKIGVEREELSLAQPSRIRSVLTPEQVAALPAWEYSTAKPPRPWDPDYRPEKKRKPPAPAAGATTLPG